MHLWSGKAWVSKVTVLKCSHNRIETVCLMTSLSQFSFRLLSFSPAFATKEVAPDTTHTKQSQALQEASSFSSQRETLERWSNFKREGQAPGKVPRRTSSLLKASPDSIKACSLSVDELDSLTSKSAAGQANRSLVFYQQTLSVGQGLRLYKTATLPLWLDLARVLVQSACRRQVRVGLW